VERQGGHQSRRRAQCRISSGPYLFSGGIWLTPAQTYSFVDLYARGDVVISPPSPDTTTDAFLASLGNPCNVGSRILPESHADSCLQLAVESWSSTAGS
jgi:hypothetical protein